MSHSLKTAKHYNIRMENTQPGAGYHVGANQPANSWTRMARAHAALFARCCDIFAVTHAANAQVRLSESTGVNLFANNFTGCHGPHPVEHAPSEASIRQMPPERIYEAITTGPMKDMAEKLSDADKRLLAEFVGGGKLDESDAGDAKHMPNRCARNPPVTNLNAPLWNGWGDLSNTRFQPAKAAGLSAGQVSRLELKWAFGFPGATALYGQTIADGRVFVSSTPAIFTRSTRRRVAFTGRSIPRPWCEAA